MNQIEAFQAMLRGSKVRHERYTPNEFVFINNQGKIETEDGCIHGSRLNEFWSRYQNTLEPADGWSIVE